MRRTLLMTVTVSLLTPAAMLAGSGNTAEFVSGTVKSIPANTRGSLDAANPAELRFHYGGSVLALSYQNITDTQVTDPAGRRLWRVPVPRLGKSSRLLNISYREGGNSHGLTFKASANTISNVVSAINERRKDPNLAAAKAAIKTDTEAWWGDQYWRTTRNKAKWPQVPPENSPGVPAGTKE